MVGIIKHIDGGYIIDCNKLQILVSQLDLEAFHLCSGDKVKIVDPQHGYLLINLDGVLKSVIRC